MKASESFAWSFGNATANTEVPVHNSTEHLSSFDVAVNNVIDVAEPYFAVLGKEVRVNSGKLHVTWTEWALGHGTREKLFAIALGYSVVGFLLALYLNILTVGNVRSAGRAVRGAVRQQLLVLKVRHVSWCWREISPVN